MKSMIVRAPGGLDRLLLVDQPAAAAPGPGEIQVRIHATSLNFHDLSVITKPNRAPDGRIPMSDGAGEVLAVGTGVTEFKPGDSVISIYFPYWQSGESTTEDTSRAQFGETADGYAIECVTRPANWFTHAPKGWSHAEAATITCAGVTAWNALNGLQPVKAGDVVLVQGSGGVSVFALQLAKRAGARVIATSSSDEKLERYRALGADHLINYKTTPDWGAAAKKWTGGRGVDRVIEVGGPGTFAQSIAACRMHGHIALIGVLTGIAGEVPTAAIFRSQLTITGIYVGSREHQLQLLDVINRSKGELKPVIDSSFTLETLPDAFRRQISNAHFGKIVATW